METVKLADIRRDAALQFRVKMDKDAIAEWAAARKAGAIFPPIDLVRDSDGALWLWDGFHRTEAGVQAGDVEIIANVIEGTRRDAVLKAIGANKAHGIRRSNEDKNKAVRALLVDPEWSLMSNRELAEITGVSHTFVSNVRKELAAIDPESLNPETRENLGGIADLSEPDLARVALGWIVADHMTQWRAGDELNRRMRETRVQRVALVPATYGGETVPSDDGAIVRSYHSDTRQVSIVDRFGRPHVLVEVATVSSPPAALMVCGLHELVKRPVGEKGDVFARGHGWKGNPQKLIARNDWKPLDAATNREIITKDGLRYIGGVVERRIYGVRPMGAELPHWLEADCERLKVRTATIREGMLCKAERAWWPQDSKLAQAGQRAAAAGQQAETCPYTDDEDKRIEWLEGWHFGALAAGENMKAAHHDGFVRALWSVGRGREAPPRVEHTDKLLAAAYQRGLRLGQSFRSARDIVLQADEIRENCLHQRLALVDGGQVICVRCAVEMLDGTPDMQRPGWAEDTHEADDDESEDVDDDEIDDNNEEAA